MGIVEATLILTVAALYLSIVTGRIGANQLVSNVQLCSGPLKERDQLTVGLCKAIGKLKTIVSLDTFDGEAVLFGANTIRYSHLCLLCNKIFISSCNDLDLLCPLMRLANLHNSNIGGLLPILTSIAGGLLLLKRQKNSKKWRSATFLTL